MNETWGGDSWFANWVLPDPKANWDKAKEGMGELVRGSGAIDKTIGGLKVLSGSIFLVTDFVPGENAAKNALKKGAEEVGERVAKAVAAKAGKEALESVGEKTARQTVEQAEKEVAKHTEGAAEDSQKAGRAGRQERLRQIGDDPKESSADRGWIKQEMNEIDAGKRTSIRNPPGKELAHERGREAAKGYSYEHSNLQDKDLHKTQHKYDDFGRKNKERPVQSTEKKDEN